MPHSGHLRGTVSHSGHCIGTEVSSSRWTVISSPGYGTWTVRPLATRTVHWTDTIVSSHVSYGTVFLSVGTVIQFHSVIHFV